jgi:hypothetical protein
LGHKKVFPYTLTRTVTDEANAEPMLRCGHPGSRYPPVATNAEG